MLVGQLEGVALLVLPIIGAWALVAELVFGTRAQRLLRLMTERGALPIDDLPHLPSGRPDREAADREFPATRPRSRPRPATGRAGYRLALAYDASGDRRRARWATRRAIRLERVTPEPPPRIN